MDGGSKTFQPIIADIIVTVTLPGGDNLPRGGAGPFCTRVSARIANTVDPHSREVTRRYVTAVYT